MKVLDSTAIIAFFLGESGADVARRAFDEGVIAAPNACEVLMRLGRAGVPMMAAASRLDALGLQVASIGAAHIQVAAALPADQGLSLGDRMCIALACERNASIVTADRAWASLNLPVAVELIR